MKQFLIGLWFCCAAAIAGQAQQVQHFNTCALIKPYRLDITWHKTTLLIFPSAIQSADRGDKYVLAEKIKGTDNILKVKAGQKDFKQSNLSVVTADGKVYTFIVNYNPDPSYQAIDLREQRQKAPVQFSGLPLNKKEVSEYMKMVSDQGSFLHGVKQHKYQMKFKLQGIYVKDDLLFFCFSMKNRTQLHYDIDFLRFYVKDKKQSKRTAVQKREIHPLLFKMWPETEKDTGKTIVAAFKKFSVADDKNFIIEMMEKNGDRNFQLKVPQHKFLKAKMLPPLQKN